MPPPPAPAALSSNVQPTAYRLDVTVDPAAPDYQGRVDIDVTVDTATRTVWLSAGADLQVTGASVTTSAGDAVATVLRPPDQPELVGVTTATPLAGAATLHLAFAGAYRERDGLFVQDAHGGQLAPTSIAATASTTAQPRPAWAPPHRTHSGVGRGVGPIGWSTWPLPQPPN